MANLLNTQNRKDFYKLLDQLEIASVLFDDDFQLLFANKEALKLFNINSSFDETDFELFSSNGLIKQIKERIRKIKSGNTFKFDLTESSLNKKFEITATKIPIDKSSVIFCKLSTSTAETSEDVLNSFINTTHDLFLIIDPKEYKILAANDNALRVYNTSKEKIIGSNFIYLSRIPEKEIEHLQKLNLTNLIFEYETIHLDSNGDDIFLKAKVSKIFYNSSEAILFSASETTSDKITENKLVSIENRFKVLFENSPLMTFIIDSDGNILSTNSAVQMELQYVAKEIIGKHISKIYHPDDEQLINFQISQCLQNRNKPFTWELRLLDRFNNTLWVRVSAVSFASEKGEPEVMIVCDNITVQKDTEKTLIDYAKSLQRMLDASPLGVLVYSLDEENNLRLITTNHSAEEILKINSENFLYKKIEEIFPSLPHQTVVEKFKDIAKNGGNLLFQKLRYYDKNISGIYEYSAIQLAEKTVAVFFTDVTEREKALEQIAENELKYKTLFEGSNDAILLMKNEYFIDANQKALEMFACNKEELINKSPIDFSPEFQEDGESSQTKALRFIDNALKGIPQTFEWKHIRKDKTEFDADVSLFSIEIKGELFIQAIVRDITEKKKAQKQIAMFANAFKNISECVIIGDTQDNIVFVNEAFTKTYGYKTEEIIGKNVNLIRSSKNPIHIVQEILPKTLKGGWKGELINVKKSGEEFIISLSTSPIYDEKGNLIALAGIVEDITERKQNIQRLAESEERFRSLVNNIVEAVIIVDWNGKILFANQSAAKLVDLDSSEKGIGRSVTEFLHPSNIDRAIRLISFEKESEETIRDTFQLVTSKNQLRWVESMSSRIRFQNEYVLLTTLRDITERIRTEELLHLLTNALHSAANGVMITEANGKIIWVNEAIEKLSGYNEKELIGKTPSLFKSGLMPNDFYSKMWQTVQSGKVWKGELINKRKDGSYYEEEMTITPILNENNEISHFISIKQDITERKKNEREIREAKVKAEEINKLKSTFLANMSHELRTPLVGILGFAELLRDNISDKEYSEMASRIHKSGKRLLETLNSILDLSRIEANKMELKLDNINVCRVVRENLMQFEALASTKNLYLKTDLEDDEIISYLDEKILHQILNNLINNAIKYTQKGGVTIEVRKGISDNSKNVFIKIKDTGIGIPPESISKIFEEFRQVSEGLDRKFDGTGLGLTLTKKFVEVLGGKIRVESEVNKGSIFTISFPIIETEKLKSDSVIPSESEISSKDSNIFNVKPNILLVENDDASIEVTKLFLKDECELDVVANGEQALESVKEKKYDVILMDINLGRGLSGLDVTQKIRSHPGYENTPIVAVTAFAMIGDKEEFLKAGCTHYLSKPFKKNELLDLIDEIISAK
jgi:PAS domain S-box-containing protein